MATLRDIKQRITSVRSISKITQAMRMVAAAKLRKAQEAIISARPFVAKLGTMLNNLAASVGDDYYHPLLEKRKETNSVLIIAVASDRGQCGSFNTNLFRFTNSFINEDILKKHPNAKISVVPLGKRSDSHFAKEIYEIAASWPAIFQALKFSDAQDVATLAADGFVDGRFDEVHIVFNEFRNLILQTPKSVQLLPIDSKSEVKKDPSSVAVDYIFEPDKKSILDELLPANLRIQIWRALLESFAAEQASRMMAMENATNNANELIKHLDMVYNKERQSSITTEMLEIVSGAEALKKS